SRAIVYLLALIYLFIGVAIISDRFMASIEVITSQKREIRKKKLMIQNYNGNDEKEIKIA
ncbi:unnamed protein product, partial [Rotaria sp. Silwood1]